MSCEITQTLPRGDTGCTQLPPPTGPFRRPLLTAPDPPAPQAQRPLQEHGGLQEGAVLSRSPHSGPAPLSGSSSQHRPAGSAAARRSACAPRPSGGSGEGGGVAVMLLDS